MRVMSIIKTLMCRTAPVTAGLVLVLSATPLHAQAHTGHGAAQSQAAQRQAAAPTNYVQQLTAIFQRMMADPVIRERVATDPVLQRMLQSAGVTQLSGMRDAQGMNHGNMPGMQGMQGMDHGTMQMPAGATAEDQRRAFDFVVRLLSDPRVSREINDDDQLRGLFADPDVQRRLAELRAGRR